MSQTLRASGAAKWSKCPGSVAAEQILPDSSSMAASEGTVAHWISAKILRGEVLPEFGSKWVVVNKEVLPALDDDQGIEYTEEMLGYVRQYTDAIALYGDIHGIEQELDISCVTGEVGATGTPDCVTTSHSYVVVHDLKYGYTPIAAENNPQLLIYAAAVLETLKATTSVGVLTKVMLVIHQPRLGIIDEVEYTMREANARIEGLRVAAGLTRDSKAGLVAGTHCHQHYCRARGVCSAFTEYTQAVYATDLVDLPDLSNADIGAKLAAIPSVRAWCDAVENDAKYKALELGESIPGYKVVEGKRGNREWISAAEVEEAMKSFKLTSAVMYDRKLISPTTAGKKAKAGEIGARTWSKIEALITRRASREQLVPASDKRPEVVVLPAISDLPELPDDFSDLV